MNIPKIRERLYELAVEYEIPELWQLADQLYRRSSEKRAKQVSQPMTPQLRRAIVAYKVAHPDVPYSTVANVFNVNPGRVSESLHGKRA